MRKYLITVPYKKRLNCVSIVKNPEQLFIQYHYVYRVLIITVFLIKYAHSTENIYNVI